MWIYPFECREVTDGIPYADQPDAVLNVEFYASWKWMRRVQQHSLAEEMKAEGIQVLKPKKSLFGVTGVYHIRHIVEWYTVLGNQGSS